MGRGTISLWLTCLLLLISGPALCAEQEAKEASAEARLQIHVSEHWVTLTLTLPEEPADAQAVENALQELFEPRSSVYKTADQSGWSLHAHWPDPLFQAGLVREGSVKLSPLLEALRPLGVRRLA